MAHIEATVSCKWINGMAASDRHSGDLTNPRLYLVFGHHSSFCTEMCPITVPPPGMNTFILYISTVETFEEQREKLENALLAYKNNRFYYISASVKITLLQINISFRCVTTNQFHT